MLEFDDSKSDSPISDSPYNKTTIGYFDLQLNDRTDHPLLNHYLQPSNLFKQSIDLREDLYFNQPNRAVRSPEYGKDLGSYHMEFGQTHAHTVYSDGLVKPEVIIQNALNAGFDWITISDHNHKKARGGVSHKDPRYQAEQKYLIIAESPREYYETIESAKKYKADGKINVLVGLEVGVLGKVGKNRQGGVNHHNLINSPVFIESVPQIDNLNENSQQIESAIKKVASVLKSGKPLTELGDLNVKFEDGNTKYLMEKIVLPLEKETGRKIIVQANHPRYAQDNSESLDPSVAGRDYGRKSYANDQEWLSPEKGFGSKISLIEGLHKYALESKRIDEMSRSDLDMRSYLSYLDMKGLKKGVKAGPSFGGDLHYDHPEDRPATTGAFVDQRLVDGLTEALARRRTMLSTNRSRIFGFTTANEDSVLMGDIVDSKQTKKLNLVTEIGGEVDPKALYKFTVLRDPEVGDGKLAQPFGQSIEKTGEELLKQGHRVIFPEIDLSKNKNVSSFYMVDVGRTDPQTGNEDVMITAPIWVETESK